MKVYACGCVKDAYWCGKHDIYVRQTKKDPPPFGHPLSENYREPECCSCHLSAPCSFCTGDS